MIRKTVVIVLLLSLGAFLYALTESWRAKPAQPVIRTERGFELPIMRADMTVQHCTTVFKCGPERRYYIGMVKR